MLVQTTQLALTADRQLVIDWDDGQRRVYPIEELRAQCPCATCQTQRSDPASPSPLPPVEPGITIRTMDPVGSYAYRIVFSDGHDTGIYTLAWLRERGRVA